MPIPKIINFMWLDKKGGNSIPTKYQKNINSFIEYNPDYRINYWTNTNTEQVLKSYPRYYDFYNNGLPLHINKCDFARMVVLYHIGGIYSDLDFYCRRNLSPLLQDDLLIVKEPPEHYYFGDPRLCVGFLGCNERNEFIKGWIEYMMSNINYYNINVMYTTGPCQFYKYYNSLPSKPNVVDTCLILPNIDKKEYTLSRVCKGRDDNYVYTKWKEGSGWILSSYFNLDFFRIYKNFILVILVLILIYFFICFICF